MSVSSNSVPDEYDPITYYHWLEFENRRLKRSSDDFQQLFEDIMVRARPGFVRVRPYGKLGDRKCDGLFRTDSTFFQVYSPDELEQSKVQKKIDEDLDGAVKYWRDTLKKWVFVYNVRRGLPPDIPGTLRQKKEQYPYIEINHLSNDDLWEIARGLSHQQRAEVLGVPLQGKVKNEKNTTQFDQEWLNCKAESSSRAKKSSAQNSTTKDVLPTSSLLLGKLNHVPELPRNFLQRPDELEALKGLVISGTGQSVGITGVVLKVGVYGMGGIGKSVLAAKLARDEEVRRAFPDGVFWVTLGQEPTLTLRQLDLARMLGDGSLIFQDVQQGKVHLSKFLEDRICLIILDDVWQVEHAAAFNVLGQRCKLLLTTRDSRIVNALDAVEYQLDILSDEQALELLASCSGQPKETLPTEAYEVMLECGNLPLALSMIGAIVRGKPDRWGNLLHKLRNADLNKIRHQFPDYPYPDLLKAIQVSVEALEPDIQAHYLDFAVFPEDAAIPEAALETFWESKGLDEYDTQDVVDVLVERSLVRRDDDGNLSLHDLQYDYVHKQAADLSALHNRLLDAYAIHCSGGWHTGQNDGYFFEHLAYHLKKSGREDELYTLLIASPDWMEAKFSACRGDAAYVADLDLAINDFIDPLEPNQLLILVQLHTARQVVNHRVSFYENTDLATLVWLGHEAVALNCARLRSNPERVFHGLLTIHNALQEKGQLDSSLLDEAWEVLQWIEPQEDYPANLSEALSSLAAAMALVGCEMEVNAILDRDGREPEANAIFAEAIDIARVIEGQ